MEEQLQNGEPFVLELNPSSGDESEDDTNADDSDGDVVRRIITLLRDRPQMRMIRSAFISFRLLT
ncbi:ribosome biogenesis protein TSR3-like protein [Pyrus ussuriensis x Pyrus communis]|uniref:Ribosome biogenesis protein TSR3-like protein n=1 Tax=Pyrus ussuriensis x Pyrus communis TaxID=2448454 RepID=A0A5N5H0Q9_9ROSA|nr:ribosome biogenesis protein TSR3-like protein [Pyrus ussuriensis x Pyrus communis]